MSVNIRIDPSLLEIGKNTRKGLISALGIIGTVTQRQIKRTKRFKDRSGVLRATIIPQNVNRRDLSVTIVNKVFYATYVNDGTRFINARQYMEEGLEKAAPSFERIVEKQLDKHI